MIEKQAGPKFLLWVTSGHFEERIQTYFRQTHLNWSTFIDLTELEDKPSKQWLAIVMNGQCQDLSDHLITVRSRKTWRQVPLVFLGGSAPQKIQELNHCIHHAMPETGNELEWILRSACSPFKDDTQDDQKDLRSSYRHICYANSSVELNVSIVDFSEGGAQLESSLPIPVGTVLKLNMQSINQRMPSDLLFEVLQLRPSKSSPMFRIHGKYANLTANQVHIIRRALMNHQGAGPQAIPAG